MTKRRRGERAQKLVNAARMATQHVTAIPKGFSRKQVADHAKKARSTPEGKKFLKNKMRMHLKFSEAKSHKPLGK